MRVWRAIFFAALAAAGIVAGAAATAQQNQEPGLAFVFEELVTLGPAVSPGQTPRGGRNIVPITGGTFEGPGKNGEGIRGTIVPGGWDWQLIRPDGCLEVKADYMLKTDDGAIINVVNEGALCRGEGGAPAPARTQPRFEAPTGKYEWLNQAAFIGTLDLARAPDGGAAVKIRIYRAT
jgi:hypothetical protein